MPPFVKIKTAATSQVTFILKCRHSVSLICIKNVIFLVKMEYLLQHTVFIIIYKYVPKALLLNKSNCLSFALDIWDFFGAKVLSNILKVV